MNIAFHEANHIYSNGEINQLMKKKGGMRFLKLKSMSRKAQLLELLEYAELSTEHDASISLFEYVYSSDICETQIDNIIREIYGRDRALRASSEDELISELYKMQSFDWGGLYQNNLERAFINNYVKKIKSFESLEDAIDGSLLESMRGYVKCSWYNHWTSIIIEDIFTDHPSIIPAVGRVKQIDFFYKNIAFDLKVTYLPEGYVKGKRKNHGLPTELKIMRECAKRQNISIPKDFKGNKLEEWLHRILSDSQESLTIDALNEMKLFRDNIIDDLYQDPTDLIVWLYEHQGTRRFDTSNRMFIVLINRTDHYGAWKLKRAKDILSDKITGYLDDEEENIYTIQFNWNQEQYEVKSGILIIEHK